MIAHTPTCPALPLFNVPPRFSGRSPKIRQRRNRHIAEFTAANGALNSINSLVSSSPVSSPFANVFDAVSSWSCGRESKFSSSSNASSPSEASPSHPSLFNAAQIQRVRAYVLAAAKQFVCRAATGSDNDSVDSTAITYSDASSSAVPLIADKVSLPEHAGAVQLVELLPPSLAAQIATPSDIVTSQAPTVKVRSLMMASQPEYLRLIKRMKSCNMLSFTTSPKCVNGIFAVKKDSDSQRIIVNARPANSMFAEPPQTVLPTPDLLSSLILDRAAQLFVAKVDISNFYHQLALPDWMHAFFALPAVNARELGLDEFGDADVFPCCRTLPMGWSWSVFLAQAAHENLIYTQTSLKRSDSLANANDNLLNRLRHSLYIDDMSFFSTDERSCRAAQVVLPSSTGVEVVGVMVHGQEHTRGRITGKQAESLVGRWSWAFLARRPAFSVFAAVYRFCAVASDRNFNIWESVRRELLVACGLAPLLVTCISAPFLGRIIASDSSSSGQGVVASHSPASVVQSLVHQLPTQPPESPSSRVERILISQRWSNIVSARWRDQEEHINCKEMRAAATALRWVASLPSAFAKRALLLSDSSVTTGVVSKGRSSAFTILQISRHIAAVAFAFNIQLYVRWIPSQSNPSDKASRRYE